MEICGSGAGAQAKRGATVLLISIKGLSDQYPTATGGRQKGEKAKGRTLVPAPGLDQSIMRPGRPSRRRGRGWPREAT